MKLSCSVARDLLPLYHDGVCSGESRELVENHLKSCPSCAALLEELRGELELPHAAPDDGAVLKKLEKSVKRGKRRGWLMGAAAALSVLLVLACVVYGRWYVDTRAFYETYAQGHETRFETNVYSWENGDYYFQVRVPQNPGEGGSRYVRLIREQNTINVVPGEEIDVWLNFGRDENFTYLVGLEVRTRTQIPGEPRLKTEVWTEYLMLDEDLNLVYPDYLDEADCARQDRILVDYAPEIMAIIEAAQAEWPVLTE